ncbi:gp6 [Listeria phage P40]|uniref:major head protein n=1 Tax=Listeria phage P40 TaxID=560178 RepID=UPI00018198BD|nr:major head protein [Listeria phage P40]ACI00366.1 gp6 [Listeria phage P40]
MANSIAYADLFQSQLDEAIQTGIKSGFLEANPNNVQYNGGNTMKIASIVTTGLNAYDRENGYGTKGTVTLTWETKTFDLDRSATFSIDAMDVDESNNLATAANVLNVFQKTQVVPEIDKYRFTKLAQEGSVTGGVVDATAPDSASQALFTDIAKMLEVIDDPSQLVIITSPTTLETMANSARFRESKNTQVLKRGEVDTKVEFVNDIEVVQVPSAYLYDKVTITSGAPSYTGAKAIPYIIAKRDAATGIVKADNVKIFDPAVNQEADAYKIQVRIYHTLFVAKNQKAGILKASFKTA